jgi:hypothetical protein
LLQQRIEDVRTCAGQTVTVTFFAKAASAFTMPSLTWQQNFGTGGSPSAGPSTNLATNIAITTSWTKYTYTVKVPSISGYTIGTTTPGFLGLRFFLPLNTTFTFDLWGVQVEQNYQPTPFEQRPIGTELALCQRYYTKSYLLNTTAGSVSQSGAVMLPSLPTGNTLRQTIFFKQTMRAAPNVTIYNPETGTAGYMVPEGQGASNNAAAGVTFIAESNALVYSTSAPIAGIYYFQYVAEKEL